MPNEISVIFHNVLNYDYHFIIKELANESKRQFECKIQSIQISLILLSFRNKLKDKRIRDIWILFETEEEKKKEKKKA